VLSTGAVTTLAGSHGLRGGVDGDGAAARFRAPWGIVTGGGLGSTILVADLYQIRAVSTTGHVTTIVGAQVAQGSLDGPGLDARFASPADVVGLGGALFVADAGNYSLRRVDTASGEVTTLAGMTGVSSLLDGTGSAAAFLQPDSLAVGGAHVYVADHYAVRDVDPVSALVSTRAGASSGGTVDGDGSAARFTSLGSASSDGTYLYVADNCKVRRVTLSQPWTVATIMGQAGCGAQDGDGATGRLSTRVGLQLVGDVLFIGDADNGALRTIDVSTQPYALTTVAGTLGAVGAVDGTGTSARFQSPLALAYDGVSLFIVDDNVVRQVEPGTMRVTTLLGRRDCRSSVDGDHASAALNAPTGITFSPATGNLYVVDSGENVLREIE